VPLFDDLALPVVLAPLAGGPSTPELAAAVSNAGGLGFLALGYLSAEQSAERLGATRALTSAPFGVNVFAPVSGPAEPRTYEPYIVRLGEWAQRRGYELGAPRFGDDDYGAKVELLESDPPAVVSFTFSCPERAVVERLQRAGSEVWLTVTTPDEARLAAETGADALVVQGAEAGGHRGSFEDGPEAEQIPLQSLLHAVAEAVPDLPRAAAGGIATPGGVAAALAAGAAGAVAGTAFMLCPEAGTSAAHREAIRSDRPTALTRAFSGRTARGIVNEFMEELDEHAPFAYPEIHYVTAPARAAARERGDGAAINLWAGKAHALAREAPAGEIARELAG
jgi:nitronate monooxygenase